jgi:hypothetical protein
MAANKVAKFKAGAKLAKAVDQSTQVSFFLRRLGDLLCPAFCLIADVSFLEGLQEDAYGGRTPISWKICRFVYKSQRRDYCRFDRKVE